MDDHRIWARGKTAEELLGLGDQMFTGLVNVAQTQPTYQQPTYQQPTYQPQDDGGLDDDAIIDGRMLKNILGRIAAPQADPGMQHSMGQLAYSQAKSADAKSFGKWEPEILTHLNQLPKQMWTIDNIQRVVRMVKAEHIDELAAERAESLISQKGFSVRTTGAAGNGQIHHDMSLESDELPADYRDRLKKAGVSMETVRSFCVANGMPVKDWFALAKKTGGVLGGAA